MKNLTVLFLLFFFASCANFVNNMHRQIDREENAGKSNPDDLRNQYANTSPDSYRRFRPENDKRPIKEPVTYSLGQETTSRPAIKRQYRPKRYKADDFVDSDNEGSLWANQGSSSSLFTYQNDKRTGDMVIINVLENLRNQISSELKNTFPDKPKRNDGKGDNKAAATTPTSPNSPASDSDMDMKVYDKISGTVMEEVSKDYILLRGRKDVIFKKEKRSIEVQALVSRKDIMENDYVNSDRLLDSRVFILGKK